MSRSITALLADMATCSSQANSLVSELFESHSSEIADIQLTGLKDRIKQLEDRVSELSLRLADESAPPLTDDERAQLAHQFEKRLKTMTPDAMRIAFSLDAIKALDSNDMRYLVCRILCAEFETRMLPQVPLWSDTLVQKGSI